MSLEDLAALVFRGRRSIAMFFAAAAFACAAEVRLADGSRTIHLDSKGVAIAGLQLDLLYDADRVAVQAEATPAVSEQGKELVVSKPARGVLRLLVIGSNPHPMLDDAFARLLIIPAAGDLIRLANIVATSPEGQMIHTSVREDKTEESGRVSALPLRKRP
jgi:hypothetical protein